MCFIPFFFAICICLCLSLYLAFCFFDFSLKHLGHDTPNLKYLDLYPPVFIIGPPRSGTTVLYQLLCKHTNFSYINNFIGHWYRIPILAAKAYNTLFQGGNELELNNDIC